LNTTPEQVAQRQQERLDNAAARAKAGDLAPAIVDTPITLQERFETRVFESVGLRVRAFEFFLGLAKDRPFGFGTGFTNGFQTGPHNSFLKLAVDEGILAALCLVAMLCATTIRAISMRSPALLSISMTVWLAALLFHTVPIDPFFTPALAIGLGLVSDRRE
jgi:O-antigen ligase